MIVHKSENLLHDTIHKRTYILIDKASDAKAILKYTEKTKRFL